MFKLLSRFAGTVAVLLSVSSVSMAQAPADTDWEIKKDQDGIQIYTRSVAGSRFKAVRSVMMSDFRLASVVALIRDNSACTRWADLCKESRVLEEISETESLAYNLNDIPWPVKDRDAITRVVWEADAQTGAVRMTATAIESDLVPASKKAVRLKNAVTKWILTPQEDGRLEIANEGHIDPSGPTPAWMTNLLLVDSPFKTMKSLRLEMSEDRYTDSNFDFIPD